MLEKALLDLLQSLAKLAFDKEVGEIPANLLSKDEVKLLKKGAKEVAHSKKKGEVVPYIFEIWYPLGKLAHKLQLYKEAEILYRAVIEHTPQFPDAWYNLGLLMSAKGLHETARGMFHTALNNAAPNWTKADRARLLAGQKPTQPQIPKPEKTLTKLQEPEPVPKVTKDQKFKPVPKKVPYQRPEPEKEHHWGTRGRSKTSTKPNVIRTGKCAICEENVGNLGFICRHCSREFCTNHRLPEKHGCTGTYRVTLLREKQVPTDPLDLIHELLRIGKAASDITWVNVSSVNLVEFDFDILKQAYRTLKANDYQDLPQADEFLLWFNAGKVAHHFRLLEIAEGFYNKALVYDTSVEIYENQALVLKEQTKWPESEGYFRKILLLEPENAKAWMNLGKVLDAQNRVEEAKAAFDTALQHDPSKIRELVGDSRWDYVLPKERDEILFEQIRGGRENAGLWFSLGNNFHDRGMYQEAEDAYQKGLKIDPRADFAWNNLGIIMMETGRFAEAEKYFRHAIDLNPHHPTGYCNLGSLLRELGRDDEAINFFQKVTENFPENAWAWMELGVLHTRNGRKAEGDKAFERALAIDPNLKQYFSFILDMLGIRGKRKSGSPPPGLYS